MILHLGVLDQAYSDASGSDGTTTTFKVASILESNYHIMATFVELRREKIAGLLANSMAAALQDRINGAPKRSGTYGAEQKIETLFRQFIFSNEMSRLQKAFTGQDLSAAAAAGVNHRKSNKARPAFVDTGLYVASFRAWQSEDASDNSDAALRGGAGQETALGYLARAQSGATDISPQGRR